jgi:hypothetical protein
MKTPKINVPRGMFTVGELVAEAMKTVPEGLRRLEGVRIEAWLQKFAIRLMDNACEAHVKAGEAAIRHVNILMLDPDYEEHREQCRLANRKDRKQIKFQRQIATIGRGDAVDIRR